MGEKTKADVAKNIRAAAENLRAALQESLEFDTIRIQMQVGGGHHQDVNGKEMIKDFQVDVNIVDVNIEEL